MNETQRKIKEDEGVTWSPPRVANAPEEGLRLLVCCLWFVVCGLWFVVCGLWFVVCGLWFVVRGLWFVVRGLRLLKRNSGAHAQCGSIEGLEALSIAAALVVHHAVHEEAASQDENRSRKQN